MTVTVVPCSADNVLVLQLAGEIDLRTVERLRECLYAHLSAGAYRGIVLDCTEVTFLAACGIGLRSKSSTGPAAQGSRSGWLPGVERCCARWR